MFPQHWPFPRGDLYHWIPVLDRFDEILEKIIKEYRLHNGPQTLSFGRKVLLAKSDGGDASKSTAVDEQKLDTLGFGPDGDRELAESILKFSRLLMDSCGNRSLYNSSERLGDLLNTTSLSLLTLNLHLAFRLAIRYHYSRARSSVPHTLSSTLLNSHYNISLERVQKLADPFVKGSPQQTSQQSAVGSGSGSKGKEKAASGQRGRHKSLNNNDLVSFVKEDTPEALQEAYLEFGNVNFQYYRPAIAPEQGEDGATSVQSLDKMPTSPTPARRTSGLSRSYKASGEETSGSSEAQDSIESQSSTTQVEQVSGYRTIRVSHALFKTHTLEQILSSHLAEIPKAAHYEFLHRLRVAKGMADSRSSRLQVIELRILAIMNLAYIYPENMFQQKLLQQDSDEPRRLQIVQQLADITRPASKSRLNLPLELRTTAISALEALSKHKARFADVCSALQVNVNHGIIFHVLQEAVEDLASDSSKSDGLRETDWRESLFQLLDSLPATGTSSRTAETLIGAGLFDILVKVLELKTRKAERVHSRILMFIMAITHGARDSLQTFANSRGFDVVADLVAYEVTSSLKLVEEGNGLRPECKSQVMDYQMPFFKQQTLRWLFKFINSMLVQQTGNVDRLIRNLIDSPQLLNGLRLVIQNAKIFGSNIWSGAINIMSSFIHNEPTSYAVIVEAGLSKALLEAITFQPIAKSEPNALPILEANEAIRVLKSESEDRVAVHKYTSTELAAEEGHEIPLSRSEDVRLARGILPATDTICQIPQAFGAMCLNASGLELFLSSGALDVFFEVFESAEHVKSLSADSNTSKVLGSYFDELVRHHPRLKHTIIRAIVIMMARVGCMCRKRAEKSKEGARLWSADSEDAHRTGDSAVDTGDDEIWETSSSVSAGNPAKTQASTTVTDHLGVIMNFLVGFCENQTSCTSLIQAGGVEFILDFAVLPSLPYDFNNRPESQELARVVRMLVENKPHLVLPAILVRTKQTLAKLEPFTSYESNKTFFSQYLTDASNTTEKEDEHQHDGSMVLKAFVEVHTLCTILQECFLHPIPATTRTTLFGQVNLADYYCPLVDDLGKLHRVCLWEEILLQGLLPDSLKDSMKIDGHGFGTKEADSLLGLTSDSSGGAPADGASTTKSETQQVDASGSLELSSSSGKGGEALSRNAPILRYLLSQIPITITPFLRGLGRSLIGKRRLDAYLRQNAYKVADSIAGAAIAALRFSVLSDASTEDRFAYLIVVLTSIAQLIADGPGDRPHSQCLILVLQAFKKMGGLRTMDELLQMFFKEVCKESEEQERALLSCALGGMRIVLSFYLQLTNPKHINDSLQSQTLQSSEREHNQKRDNPYYFSANQFLVDLRVQILSSVKPIWNSAMADQSSVTVVKTLVDILRTIMEADHENGALTRSDPVPKQIKPETKSFAVADRQPAAFQSRGIPADLASEALYRCLNNREAAEEYCNAHLHKLNIPRVPIPAHEQFKRESKAPSPSPVPRRQESAETMSESEREPSQEDASVVSGESETANTDPPADVSNEGDGTNDAEAGPVTPTMDYLWTGPQDAEDENGMAMSIDNLLNLSEQATEAPPIATQQNDTDNQNSPAPLPTSAPENLDFEGMSTVDELNDLRSEIRANLIDHVLDMLSAHEGITFDLADLITTAASKAPDAATMQKEVGETLVESLISFQMDEDFRPNGQKVASYANLLAIILQQKEFYDAAFQELKDNFEDLVKFVRIFNEAENGDNASPWVAQILLVLEKLLAEDVQPQQVKWAPPTLDTMTTVEEPKNPIAEIEQPKITPEEKGKLFEAVVDILPRIGKDDSLALSAVRILVILSRDRLFADRLGDKHYLQRLFVMVKQLAGVSDERFQKTFLLVLRHIMEDEDTIREAIRGEIFNFFKPARTRQHDTTTYIRHMAHLIIRAPALFLEVTNEHVKLEKFEPSHRPQTVALKKLEKQVDRSAVAEDNARDGSSAEAHPTTEDTTDALSNEEKVKPGELKVPTVERPDGVTHYLLSQLLSYRDVDDKETDELTNKTNGSGPDKTSNNMTSSESSQVARKSGDDKKADQTSYQAEQHPIYHYRCFLLQCLTELLMSYPAAKIEFINFSAKADPKAVTPSKPRSGALNYLLTRLIPCGTLERPESVQAKKRCGQSNWAMCVIAGLCLKPNYRPSPMKDDDGVEDPDSDLLFVRKFVLENALKAFKDATATDEPLDAKYGRLLSLADLFIRLLMGRVVPNIQAYSNEITSVTLKEIAKVMFEKNYISTLTNAIADIDLNFPNSRRVIKYILRPLKTLTDTAIELSQNSDISSTLGQSDEDNISTASSVSETDVEREETPDLFRNSTLGILEPGGEEELSSESSVDDEDMYDDEYGDEMEYEEELERDGDEVVSDEDDELDEAGPMEGLPGDQAMDVEVIIDGDDDQSEDGEDSEDDDDDDEDMDDDDEVEIFDDEINGDDENDSLASDSEDEWQDEDGGDDYEDGGPPDDADLSAVDEDGVQDLTNEDEQSHDLGVVGGDLVLDLQNDIQQGGAGPPPGVFDLEMDVDNGRYAADDDDDDEDDEDIEEEDVAFDAEFDDEDGDVPPWGWDADDEPDAPAPRHHHHHHGHGRRIPSPWTIFPPGADRGVIVPAFRSHTRSGGGRANDEGTNPLLHRSPSSSTPNQASHADTFDPTGPFGDWIQMFHSRNHRPGGPISIINSMMTAMGAGGLFEGGGSQALHLHIGGGRHGSILPLPGDLHRLLSTRRGEVESSRQPRDDSSLVPLFTPTRTLRRWQEEAQMLFGANNYVERTQKVVNALLKLLVPAALEEEKTRKEVEAAKEAERKRKAEEAKAEEERLAKEKADREAQGEADRLEQEANDRESAHLAAAGSAEILAEVQGEAPEHADAGQSHGHDNSMEGLETVLTESTGRSTSEVPAEAGSTAANEPAASTANEASTEPQGESSDQPAPVAETARVRATFRGREVDITGLGIDLEYLNALPDDLREEVLMQQLAEQRSQAAVAGEAPTEISPEFLNALPPDIRQEILQEEAADRRRREREEARRQATANGTAPAQARAEDMDPASFLASLDPALRNAVLLEQDDDVLAQLPAAIAAEARALGGDRGNPRWFDLPRLHRSDARRRPPEEQTEPAVKKPKRQVVQMLDKAGVATLLRLLFISQQGTSREALNKILENVSQNRQNRAEVLSLLLSVLHEGSVDVNAIEKSFMHLSIRAKPPQSGPKSPHPLKRTPTGSSVTPLNSDMSPATIIQQCLSTLVYLTTHNVHVPSFFLAENDNFVKGRISKKGKGKENRAAKFALNSLLNLLDRPLILDSAGCMEQLSTLLQSITHPLTILQKKEKATEEKADNKEENNGEATQGAEGSQEAQPAEQTPPSAAESGAPPAEDEQPRDAGQPTAQEAEASTKPQETEAIKDTKKERNLVPPAVPEHNLRLVVGVLAARECSAKTFRDTVSTISNLSAIPDAKEIFGKELIMQAQNLGNVISKELDDLVPQIKRAEMGSDVQGAPAMTKFAAPSSDQAKLLRVLTALDYLFDPKRISKIERDGEEAPSSSTKDDVLTTLYESSTFGPLWNKLSECLGLMKERGYMLNVATILLPLIEALMVICKNATLKDTATQKSAKDFAVTSPVPESGMENLFFRFTEDHRKVLNELVRHNPRLMSGTFSLLVKNPKVLEFDNKRNYFTRRLHSRSEVRHPQPPLQIQVRRDQVFMDSYRSLFFKSPEEMKYGKMSIRFHGEDGVDAGGVTREWFQVMARQMFNPDYALFIPVASDRTTFHPNKLSHINPEHETFFKFIGRVIGKALYEGRALDCHFSRAVYKRILGRPVSIKDMETVDLDYYKSLLWMLENDISDIITETFSIENEAFGVTEIFDLIEDGRNIPVTEENKHEYVQLVVEYRLTGSVKTQLEFFLNGKQPYWRMKVLANQCKGFHDIVPAELISIFNEQELELLISGLPDIDVDDWKNNTDYQNYSLSSPQIQWFWRAVRSFDKEERAKLLQFVTGTSKVPLNGFKELEGMNGFSRFNIHRDYGNKDRLPSSHTCFNRESITFSFYFPAYANIPLRT